jgi:CcmD family protein
MGATIYLAAGYAVFWLVTFVFIYSMVSRQRNLQKELEMLEQLAKEDAEAG